MPEIVITCDWTMMSNHHGKEFLGFGTTTPPYLLPEAVYKNLFFPTMPVDEHGYPQQAPYGMRKIESSLMDAGFDARIVHPSHLDKYMPGGAKVLMISGHDFFGLNPPSSTFGGIMRKETLNCTNFKRMMTQPHVIEARKQGMKIIAGGPCAWQISPPTQMKLPWIGEFVSSFGGVDCVVEGEADLYVREIAAKALKDEFLPPMSFFPPRALRRSRRSPRSGTPVSTASLRLDAAAAGAARSAPSRSGPHAGTPTTRSKRSSRSTPRPGSRRGSCTPTTCSSTAAPT